MADGPAPYQSPLNNINAAIVPNINQRLRRSDLLRDTVTTGAEWPICGAKGRCLMF